ncbi:MAG: sigma-70 family RNA polymerase sigma factor [Chloroflexi bacterium]|nr:sigma-70 family RNA polymerase sigma factor [Chloroflexota bacterium]
METGPDLERTIGATYQRYRGPLQRYLSAITRDPAAAEELTQDAFLRLITEGRAGRFPDDPGAWLHRVGHNLAMSRGRRIAVADRRRADLVESDRSPSPEALSVVDEERRELRAVLDTLGRSDRVALILSSHGYRGSEIARTLGRSDGATRTLLTRARGRLRARMLASQPG